ncbi:MAG TPA: hypothetical protein PLD62_01225 [Candidatus Cloacimonadota bacterium]|nr:hypothetical protein [Candidatus Cloacimonadota bacterium]
MNKTLHFAIIAVLVLLILGFWYYRYCQTSQTEKHYEVLLVTETPLDTMGTAIQAAFSSVLEEEGVPFRWVQRGDILRYKPKDIIDLNPVIIFPDYITQRIPEEFSIWIDDYLQVGGNVLLSYDCGIRMANNRYRTKAIFSSLVGANYITYSQYIQSSYRLANIQFRDREAAKFLQIPYGKLDEHLNLSGYVYGALQYPVAFVDPENLKNDEIYAYSVYEDGSRRPNIILRHFEKGRILYANLPLGYLKAYASDELMLRTILRTFLFEVVHIPHLANMPSRKAGLVMNWHVDNSKEWKSINWAEKQGFFRQDFPFSCVISAGKWLNKTDDNLGFDAANHTDLVKKLAKFGTIGSLGGWAHNWFASQMSNHEQNAAEIEKSIVMNNQTLSDITGYPVQEFAAPQGIHDAWLTRILAKNNFDSYYFVGDSGSQPNRSFFDGKMVADNLFAFPVMPFNQRASVHELGRDHIPASEYETWLNATLDHLIDHRLATLIYSHFYDFRDFPQYVPAFLRFMDRAAQLQKEGKLLIAPMSYFTQFWLRFLKTETEFICENELLLVTLKNPESLQNITISLPKAEYRKVAGLGLNVTEDDDYYYIEIVEDVTEKLLTVRKK